MTDSYKKLTESFEVSDWEVLSDKGYVDVITTHKTEPMHVWSLATQSGLSIRAAGEHIVFRPNGDEVFLKDLVVGDTITTIAGADKVVYVAPMIDVEKTEMFDLQVGGFDQSYFTNGILSHNTATAALYLLWFAMFNPSKNVLITSYVGAASAEIMQRITDAYEMCPNHIRCGTTTYAASRIIFDNKSTIESQTTTEKTGRGKSISLLYCLDAGTVVRLRDKYSLEEFDMTLEGLYTFLDDTEIVSFSMVGLYRLKLSNGITMDVPSNTSVYINDLKVTPDTIMKGDKINYGRGYADILDIAYLGEIDTSEEKGA